MSTMIPDDIQVFKTDGENAFYRFLQTHAKPDHQYISWYLPDIQGREPDFILFSELTGLIIFEVKDWALHQIVEADPQHFTLYIDGREEKRQNPLHQARQYLSLILNKIKEDGYLISKAPLSYGNVKIPVNCGVVFPSINKFEYVQKALDKIIPVDKIFFWDDLHPQSPICSDPTGGFFQDVLKKMFTPRFDFKITGKELNHLKQLIFPVVRIDLPERDISKKWAEKSQRLKLLDHHQESIARQYDGGHRIITGPSGSGKTLILVHKAVLLKHYNPAVRNVLFICYNITLVNYIKRLLSDKHVPLGENGVEVLHFFELCSKITGEIIPYEKEDTEFYDLVIQETREKLRTCSLRYDAILIDEGQDFSDDMLEIIMTLLNPQTNHLTIAIDDNQNIYKRSLSWKSLGIHARGRVYKVSWVYRNTKEIADFAKAIFMEEKIATDKPSDPRMELFTDTFQMSRGPQPEIKSCNSFNEVGAYVAEQITALVEHEGYPLSEIAIIYTMKSPEHLPGIHLPALLGKALERKGIIHNWVSQDYRAKKSYDITTNSVAISTVHSIKGFDYTCVFVVGLDLLETGRWTEDQIKSLTYVAATRARHQLCIPYVLKNSLIDKLLQYV